MKPIHRILNRIFSRLNDNDEFAYMLCKRYIDRFQGDNNDDMATNGEADFLRTQLPDCKIVFDVGANVGDWAAAALEINAGIEVHCFEPSARTFQRLANRRFPANVKCNMKGLGSQNGTRSLFVYADASGMNSLYQRRGLEDGWGIVPAQQSETISLTTLDEYCMEQAIERIDYLKVDVEGHELEVLKGAHRLLSAGNIRAIQLEYGGCNIDSRALLKDLFEFLLPLRFEFFKLKPRVAQFVPRYDQRLENYQYQNWALLRKDTK